MIANETVRDLSLQNAILDTIVVSFIPFGGSWTTRCFLSILFEETFGIDIAKWALWLAKFAGNFGLFAVEEWDVFVEILFVHNGQFKSLYFILWLKLYKLKSKDRNFDPNTKLSQL